MQLSKFRRASRLQAQPPMDLDVPTPKRVDSIRSDYQKGDISNRLGRGEGVAKMKTLAGKEENKNE